MKEYTSKINNVKVVYNNDRKTDYPIGVQLYKGGELAFMDLSSAICLEGFLKIAIKEAANAKETNSWQ